jgi:hypothetical protein
VAPQPDLGANYDGNKNLNFINQQLDIIFSTVASVDINSAAAGIGLQPGGLPFPPVC